MPQRTRAVQETGRHSGADGSIVTGTPFAEFEVDLLRMRTREGMAVARAKGRLRGKQPKLSTKQQTELRRMRASGDYSIADLAELFTIGRATVYRTLRREGSSTAGEAN